MGLFRRSSTSSSNDDARQSVADEERRAAAAALRTVLGDIDRAHDPAVGASLIQTALTLAAQAQADDLTGVVIGHVVALARGRALPNDGFYERPLFERLLRVSSGRIRRSALEQIDAMLDEGRGTAEWQSWWVRVAGELGDEAVVSRLVRLVGTMAPASEQDFAERAAAADALSGVLTRAQAVPDDELAVITRISDMALTWTEVDRSSPEYREWEHWNFLERDCPQLYDRTGCGPRPGGRGTSRESSTCRSNVSTRCGPGPTTCSPTVANP